MKILIGCEFSGVVRDAFRTKGHDAWSCDLLNCETYPEWHIKDDVLNVLNDGWDMAIFHPPCTYLTNSAEWAFKEKQTKKIKPETLTGSARIIARQEATHFVMQLAQAPISKIAIENPVGSLSTSWRQPDQFIQPYEYGENASKKTCLWLKNLPKLKPTELYLPRLALSKDGRSYVMRWGNQTDSGQSVDPPSKDRWKKRSITWQGLANAMADQWG